MHKKCLLHKSKLGDSNKLATRGVDSEEKVRFGTIFGFGGLQRSTRGSPGNVQNESEQPGGTVFVERH